MEAMRIWPYLAGIAFPASKQDAIAGAEAAGAPNTVIAKLQTVDAERFAEPEALQLAIRDL